MHPPLDAFDPLTAFAKDLAAYREASRRTIESTWRGFSKTCAAAALAPWPLTDANIEFAVRRWIAGGATGTTLQVRQWALRRLHEFDRASATLTALSAATWARWIWSCVPTRKGGASRSRLTVFETHRLMDSLERDADLHWLWVLLAVIDRTGASLRALLQVRQRDLADAVLTLRHRQGTYAVPLEEEEVHALQDLGASSVANAYLFSGDGGATPLSSHRVNRDLGRCAEAVLGRPVSMREIQEAAIRFLLQLGVALKSLSKITGLSPFSLVRLSGLCADARDMSLMARYGIPVSAELPVFADLFGVLQRADDPFTGTRDRAILSLIYFDFATPAMVSAMEHDDVHDDGTYSLPREGGLTVTFAEHHVAHALGEWLAIRGSALGPLFVASTLAPVRRMLPQVVEQVVRERSRFLRRPFTAASLRLGGIARAANAGLPLAQLADQADMAYDDLADVLHLHQRAETAARVRQQIESLRSARLSPSTFEELCIGQLVRCYIHAGSP